MFDRQTDKHTHANISETLILALTGNLSKLQPQLNFSVWM